MGRESTTATQSRTVRVLPRGRHRLTRAEVAASQRGRLLIAMARVVADKGYANATVVDVTRQAAVSTRTFYEHFPTKEECFLAAHELSIDALVGIMRSVPVSTGQQPITRFSRVLHAYLDALADEPVMARTFLIEVYAAGPRALEQRLRAQARFADLLAKVLTPLPFERFELEALVGAISSLVTSRVSVGDYEGLRDLHDPILRLVDGHCGRSGRTCA